MTPQRWRRSSIVEARNGMPVRDIDMPSSSGLTPLHVAGMAGSNLCIAYLVGRQVVRQTLRGG